jgi:hypothetical protein
MDLITPVGDMDMDPVTVQGMGQDIGLIDMGMDPDMDTWEGMDTMIGITSILLLSMYLSVYKNI